MMEIQSEDAVDRWCSSPRTSHSKPWFPESFASCQLWIVLCSREQEATDKVHCAPVLPLADPAKQSQPTALRATQLIGRQKNLCFGFDFAANLSSFSWTSTTAEFLPLDYQNLSEETETPGSRWWQTPWLWWASHIRLAPTLPAGENILKALQSCSSGCFSASLQLPS